MPARSPFNPLRRRGLFAAAAWLGSSWWPGASRADGPDLASAHLAADFDPLSAMWLGYDAGHEDFTADLVEALWPHVSIKMLVRDAEAQGNATALLRSRELDVTRVGFVTDEHALFFVRDCAVFGADGDGQPFIVDFRWTSYGWAHWCRRTFSGARAQARACSGTADADTGVVDLRLASVLGIPSFTSALAMEGGGVEVNGRGLIIANAALWQERNGGLSRAAIEKQLLALPGMRKVIWVPHGLAHDPLHRATITGDYVGWGTGGHSDEFVRFADERTVLLAWVDEADAREHPVARLNQSRMQANYKVLASSTDQRGRPLRVVKVPLPRMVERPVVLHSEADTAFSEQWSPGSFPLREGRREGDTVVQIATTSYLNHVVANDLVLLPTYVQHGTPPEREEQVQKLYASVFPGRKVQFIDAMGLNWVGGGAHCATLSQPAGRPRPPVARPAARPARPIRLATSP